MFSERSENAGFKHSEKVMIKKKHYLCKNNIIFTKILMQVKILTSIPF